MKLCPRCKLEMNEDDALNALSHDGQQIICTLCAKIEGLEMFAPDRAYGLKIGLRRMQAAKYGLDEKGNPKLPKEEKVVKK